MTEGVYVYVLFYYNFYYKYSLRTFDPYVGAWYASREPGRMGCMSRNVVMNSLFSLWSLPVFIYLLGYACPCMLIVSFAFLKKNSVFRVGVGGFSVRARIP